MARVVNNKFIKTDPIISQFNEHEHFLRIVVEAFSEYVLEISQTGSDYHNSTHFLQVAERNICFSYICYFLFLFGFKYVQMRKAIRENNSQLLDIIWRENLASARSGLANDGFNDLLGNSITGTVANRISQYAHSALGQDTCWMGSTH